MTQWTAWSPE